MKQPRLLHELVLEAGLRDAGAVALRINANSVHYGSLSNLTMRVASGLKRLGLQRYDRVAIYLGKTVENVVSMLATSAVNGVFVPINPVLKADQVAHVLKDSGARVLVTSRQRLDSLSDQLQSLGDLRHIVLTDSHNGHETTTVVPWTDLAKEATTCFEDGLETDMAALFYTSGSTGKPKGVVLSHRNIVTGALSVAQYLENHPGDRILSLLPLSFDAGFSQLTTAFSVGARVVLVDYLLPRDAIRLCEQECITGITGVPPLWMQLVEQPWPTAASEHVRYVANTGGKMPVDTLVKLRQIFANARPYLMYGLTEAFRSTYLHPSEVDRRPDSIGRAIPNVEILVVRADGTPCIADEPGELVHRGPLVSLGYWNDPVKTAERFRPAPGQPSGMPFPEIAVWSGDTVRRDREGYLYFVGRQDDMIKTSGYRVSPTEIEEIAFNSGLVSEAVAVGIPSPKLGQVIVLIGKPLVAGTSETELHRWYREKAPAYMVPHRVIWLESLPRNPNGKIDRVRIKTMVQAEDQPT